MIHRCINPACRAKVTNPKFVYAEEVICTACWKTIMPWMTRSHRYYMREWRRCEREILMANDKYVLYYEQQFRFIAFAIAHNWSKIRFSLDVKPEFPAGLASHLREVFRDYSPYALAQPTMIPNFNFNDRSTWGIE